MLLRAAQPNDVEAMYQLICELAHFEKEPAAVVIQPSDLLRDGFGEAPLYRCLVAEMDGSIRAMALFYPRYSTWKGKTWHLEDLIVTEAYRGKGLGKALFAAFVAEAKADAVRRIEWGVLNWNTSAIEFYQKAGAVVFGDWRIAQMDEHAMAAFPPDGF